MSDVAAPVNSYFDFSRNNVQFAVEVDVPPRTRRPGQRRHRRRHDIRVDCGEAVEPAPEHQVDHRADRDPDPLGEPPVVATVPAQQAGADNVEPLEPDLLEPTLNLPFIAR